jgi:inorganic pyrophosphatase
MGMTLSSSPSSLRPKGESKQICFDPQDRVFALKKVLSAGMPFSYDFGFIPSARGGDGDPIDVLVLMDEPAFAGCKLGVGSSA